MTEQRNHLYSSQEAGFSLIEAMVASAIIGIAFVGVFMLTTYSEVVMRQAIAREKLQMQANQFLDMMDADFENIDQYAVNWEECTDPGDEATVIQERLYTWCQQMDGELGIVWDNDVRRIVVNTDPVDGTRLVYIELSAQNGDVKIVMNRSYGRGEIPEEE